MKNLKRVLSFALAAAMLVGMMVVGAGAAEFTDGETIENANAVNTLVALNVINGKDDGSFDPTAVVTRAEMAKMITVALNGGKVPTLPTNAKATYTDIGGHWAQAYIEYCAGLGIVSGRGDGTFDPNGTVTGSEAAKMMLVAMGYPSDVFGFTGANWAINVGIEANKVEMFDGIEDIDTSAGLTRDNTAQLIYNGVLAGTMTKEPSQVVGGDITWNYDFSDESIFEKKYNGSVLIGTFKGDDKIVPDTDEDNIVVYGYLEDTETSDDANDYEFTFDFDNAYVGEEVKVLYKNAKNGANQYPETEDTIYGVFLTGKTKVLNVTANDIAKVKNSTSKIEIDGKNYTLADTVTVVENYASAGTGTDTTADDFDYDTFVNGLAAQTGDTVKFILEDGKVAKAYVVNYSIEQVTAVGKEKITLSTSSALKFEDNDIAEGLEVDDLVVVSKLYNEDNKTYVVTKAEVVSGTVEGYTNDEGKTTKIVLDGETYLTHKEDLTELGEGIAAMDENCIDETFDLYLVNGFAAVAVQTSESAKNYSVILSNNDKDHFGGTFGGLQIEVMDADGTKTVLTPNSDSKLGDTVIADNDLAEVFVAGSIITWTGDEDDAKVTIHAQYVEDNIVTDEKSYNADTKMFNSKIVTTSTIIFAETAADKNFGSTDAKVKVYTLRDLDEDETYKDFVMYTNDDDEILAIAVNMDEAPGAATDETVYGIVSAHNGKVKVNGDVYACYTIENDTGKFTVYQDGGDGIAKGDIVKFDATANDIVEITKVTNDKLAVTKYNSADGIITAAGALTEDDDGKWIVSGSTTTYVLDKDCVIVYVNAEDNCAGDEIGINKYDKTEGNYNMMVVKSEVKEEGAYYVAEVIVIETSGEGF